MFILFDVMFGVAIVAGLIVGLVGAIKNNL